MYMYTYVTTHAYTHIFYPCLNTFSTHTTLPCMHKRNHIIAHTYTPSPVILLVFKNTRQNKLGMVDLYICHASTHNSTYNLSLYLTKKIHNFITLLIHMLEHKDNHDANTIRQRKHPTIDSPKLDMQHTQKIMN